MAENILLIRLKSIGDVVFTLPAVSAVRDNFPEAKITFLASKENAPLLRGFRDVNEVVALDRAVLRSGNPLKVGGELITLLRRLRAGKFSLVVDFQGYGETAWFTRLTGARERWGSVYGPGREWLYTHGVRRNETVHPADWNLSLLQQCGLKTGRARNQFILPEELLPGAKRFFANYNLDAAKPTLYLQPFTSSTHKNWPLENFLALARFWHARNVQIIFSGSSQDAALLAPARTAGFVVAAGVPRMTDMGLMQLSTMVLGGDTGFLHLAVAMGKRVLMLMKRIGPGAPVPFQHPDWIVEPSAGLAVKDIEFEKVSDASILALKECGVA